MEVALNLTVPERVALRKYLTNRFSLDELQILAFDLGLDHDIFPQETKDKFAPALIARFERDKRLRELITLAIELRDDEAIAGLLTRPAATVSEPPPIAPVVKPDTPAIENVVKSAVSLPAPVIILPQNRVEPPPAFSPLKSLVIPQAVVESLVAELHDLETDHIRRGEIGDLLDSSGDTRPGVGVRPDGLPDISWLPVTPGGRLKIEDKTFNVQPFYIAKYPTTYTQYQAFVEARDGFNNAEWWQGMPEEYQKQALAEQYHKALDNPRDRVSWYQSVAFTRWLTSRYRALSQLEGKVEIRLPTEAEWQWAAQGGSKALKYPWGEWQKGYANTKDAKLGRAIAVGMYPQGAAACGAEDMSGNVWEWCWNKYSNSEVWRVLRGGSFPYDSDGAACACRYDYDPLSRNDDLGFRVVVSSPIARSDL